MDHGQVQPEEVVQQPRGGEADGRDDDRHRAYGDEQIGVQRPFAEPRVAVDQALAGCVGVTRPELERRIFEEVGDHDRPQECIAVVRPRPRRLHQMRDADRGAGEQQAGSQRLEEAGPPVGRWFAAGRSV